MNFIIKEVPVPEVWEQLEVMAQDHWDEVPFGPFQLSLDLNTEGYNSAYQYGTCRCLCAYHLTDDGEMKLVGYMSLLASFSMKHKTVLQCVADSFYVDPAYRDKGVFQKLLNYASEMAAVAGCRFLSVGVNPQFDGWQDLKQYLIAKDYHVTEIMLTKEV